MNIKGTKNQQNEIFLLLQNTVDVKEQNQEEVTRVLPGILNQNIISKSVPH